MRRLNKTLSAPLLKNKTSEQKISAPGNTKLQIRPFEISNIAWLRNEFLSAIIPVNLAININYKLMGSTTNHGVFKQFSDELQQSLNITGCSPEFVAKLIPEYLTLLLQNRLRTGELLAFRNRIESDLNQAYDASLPEAQRDLYKIRAFKTMMLEFGPHGLKYIQSLRPKNPNHWVSEAILTAQSDLPAVPLTTVEESLKEAFRVQGTLKYADHFSDYFEVVKVLGAGSVGIVSLIKFREIPKGEEKELVVKIIRPGIIDRFHTDNRLLNTAVDHLVEQKIASSEESKAFKNLSEKKLEEELRETNPNLENIHLHGMLYQGRGITTVKGNLNLTGKAHNIVFMEKAQGIELGKYLKKIRKLLSDPTLSDEEREHHLSKLAALRKQYCQLSQIHHSLVAKNSTVHTDLHPGNIFYDPESQLLSILDLGAVGGPVSDTEHLQLRRFLFYLYLSVGTADSHYLQFYYDHYKDHSDPALGKPATTHVAKMLREIQEKLDEIKKNSLDKNVIDTENAINDVMAVISKATLSYGSEIVPNALVTLARSNHLIASEFTELTQNLADSHFASEIPFSERTQLALALKASWNQGRAKNAELWTQEVWDYFKQNSLSLVNGVKRLHFEKKFIYGIFGLNEQEAAIANVLIPASVISAPLVIYLSGKTLHQTIQFAVTKLPDLALSYRFLQACKNIQGLPVKDVFNRLNTMVLNHRLFKEKLPNPATVKMGINHFRNLTRHNFFTSPVVRRGIPGLIATGVSVYAAKKVYDYSKS